MNAKITSLIIITSMSTAVVASLLTAIVWYNIFERHLTLPLNCTAMVYVDSNQNQSEQDKLRASLKIVFHIQDDLKMRVTEYGSVEYNGKEYTLDRMVNMTMSARTQNGFYEIARDKAISNIKSNVPPLLLEHLASSQPVLFYKIDKIATDVWRISDLHRTIFVCGH